MKSPEERARIRARMSPEARDALRESEKARLALAEQMKRIEVIRKALAARVAAKENAWGIEITPGIGKAVKRELDLARAVLARKTEDT